MNPDYINARVHKINVSDISNNAIHVVQTLNKHGYAAYLVGGGIRDLLLGKHPKDFDISTNARPEEVTPLFKRARIIGRRFKIAHVYFGKEIIEVTTFRGNHPEELEGHPHAIKSNAGQLLRDNIYGSLEEDALRRDFTVNSLYYDFDQNRIIDYTGAFDDLKNKVLRVIGNPDKRYREDPVRMLRAVRFAAKLGFTVESQSAEPIPDLARLLRNIPPARLFDESLKLLLSGFGEESYRLACQYGLFVHLFPETDRCLQESDYRKLIELALCNTDTRIAKNKRTTPAFLFAVLLWPALQDRLQRLRQNGAKYSEAWLKAKNQVLSEQIAHTAIPRRFSLPMRDIWDLQYRLERRGGKRAFKLLSHPRFRAAYDFLLLREQSRDPTIKPISPALGQWWTEFQEAGANQRNHMIASLDTGKRRRPRKKVRAGQNPA